MVLFFVCSVSYSLSLLASVTGRLDARRVISHGHPLFWKPDSPPKPLILFGRAMVEAANNSINFIITGDEDPQMEGQDDPIQEERREELYTHVFEG